MSSAHHMSQVFSMYYLLKSSQKLYEVGTSSLAPFLPALPHLPLFTILYRRPQGKVSFGRVGVHSRAVHPQIPLCDPLVPLHMLTGAYLCKVQEVKFFLYQFYAK